jgi:fructoselysine 3-epimerase
MRYSQSSAVYFNYSLRYAIRNLHVLGYDGIEIWGGRPHMYKDDLLEERNAIKELLRTENMSVCNFIPAQFRYPSHLCSANEKVRTDSVNYITAAIKNAMFLESKSISLCPGMVLFDSSIELGWKKLRQSFLEIEQYVHDKDFHLLIEPGHKYETNLILTVEDALKMIDELKSNRFGILIDTGHCQLNGESLYESVLRCRGLPLHIHLDDNHGEKDSHLIPGKGEINFNEMKRGLEEIRYDGFLSCELGTDYILEPEKACQESLLWLKKFILRTAR